MTSEEHYDSLQVAATLRSYNIPMDKDAMIRLKNMQIAPYIQLASVLIGKPRRSAAV